VDELKKVCDDLGKAFQEFKTTHAKEVADAKANGQAWVSGEVKEKLAKIDAALNDLDEKKSKVERLIVAAKEARDAQPNADEGRAGYKAAFANYLRTNNAAGLKEAQAQFKAMSGLSGPEGGFWVSFETDPQFRQDFVETSPMRQVATVQTIGEASMKGRRRVSRASTGGWVGEADTRAATGTPTLGEWEIVAREMYAYPEAPASFLADAVVDVEGWLAGEIAAEFSILENTAFISGNGVKRPRGIVTYPTTDGGDGAFIATQEIATSNALAANDLISLQGLLKEPYQNGASWMFTRATMTAIRKLVVNSTTANYVWQPGLQAGVPSLLLDKPYTLHADLAEIAAAAATVPILYGNFRTGYKIVDRAGIRVIRDEVTNKGYVGFYSVKRVGGDVVHFEAIKTLTNKT